VLVAAASYGLGAAAFALLAVAWYLTHRRQASKAFRLDIPATATALWAALEALRTLFQAGRELVALAELFRNLAWLWFLWRNIRELRGNDPHTTSLASLGHGLGLLGIAALIAQALSLVFPHGKLIYLAYAVFPTLMAIAGMVMVEQLYRNAIPQDRWSLKFLCLALGGMFAFDFFLYSEAMLFSAYSPDTWAARGAVNALLVPLIWISARRQPTESWPVVISHRMAFHTIILLGAGIYLMLMAAAGYYIRIVGGDWGNVLQSVFLFGAGSGAGLPVQAFFPLPLRLSRGVATLHLHAHRGRPRHPGFRAQPASHGQSGGESQGCALATTGRRAIPPRGPLELV
jgi:putative PEP-CTERM system histidine kinase